MNHHENLKGKSRITHRADNLDPITRQGKPLCHLSLMVQSFPSVATPPPPSPPPNPHGIYCASGIFMFVQQKIPTLGPADSYEIPTRGPKIYESMSANDPPWRQDKRCVSLKEAKNKNSGRRNEWTTVLSSQMRSVTSTQ